MIRKNLIALLPKTMHHVWIMVASQILALLATVLYIFQLAEFLQAWFLGNPVQLSHFIVSLVVVILIRSTVKKIMAKQGALAAEQVKIKLRCLIYEKILRLGQSYEKHASTAEILQISSEGIEQLELYFSSYLPQFFYCMTAPLLLLALLWDSSPKAAFVLFICVPLIPISIVIVQKIAKKLLAKYWALYAGLGDSFLENLQGLTTLKIYGADQAYQEKMNENAENFRKITMKVLSMQLNSIIVMDVVAYGGAALGAIIALSQFQAGEIHLAATLSIILLASEFFLPMRLLGSYFHIAMNGMAASDKMFRLLDQEEPSQGKEILPPGTGEIVLSNLSFGYTPDQEILSNISFSAGVGMTAIVGVSGSGKSTLTKLLSQEYPQYQGEITLCGVNLQEIQGKSLWNKMCKVTQQPYLFGGTVRENLALASPSATAEEMISVLKKVKIWDLFQSRQALDTPLQQRGANLSGGERQRLCLARALLCQSEIYIFDEVTSNIDVESETAIMQVISQLAEEKLVILIAHRLANVVQAQQILYLEQGKILETGTHSQLVEKDGAYAQLFHRQQQLESLGNAHRKEQST